MDAESVGHGQMGQNIVVVSVVKLRAWAELEVGTDGASSGGASLCITAPYKSFSLFYSFRAFLSIKPQSN